MPTINYTLADGTVQPVEVPEGLSVMLGAIREGIEGIVAECGGSCSCATCHVYVHEDDFAKLDPASEFEEDLLGETAAERRPTSRLSCQITVTAELDGLRVEVPDRQY